VKTRKIRAMTTGNRRSPNVFQILFVDLSFILKGSALWEEKNGIKNLNQAGGIGLYHFKSGIPLTAAIHGRVMLEFIGGDSG
jgi:hypothetical protein